MSNLDYSGGRKTHRFPPPYGLGSLSLTHRPTENPTGVTNWRGLQGILNHAPPCSAVQNDALKVKPLRDTPHPDLPQSGEDVFKDSLPYSGRVRVGSDWFFVIPGCDPESHSLTDYEGRNNFKTLYIRRGYRIKSGMTHWRLVKGTPARRSESDEPPLRETPHPAFPKSGKVQFVTLYISPKFQYKK